MLHPLVRARVGERGMATNWVSVIFTIRMPGAIKLPRCKFEHKKLSAAEAAKLVKPPGRESRANSPAAKAKAKAKSKAETKKQPRSPSYCFKFISPGSCNDANCLYMHLTEEAVAEFKRSKEALRKLQEKKP